MKKKSSTQVRRPHKLYILMRNDIQSLNAGKAMAQAAHAANHFIANHGKLATVNYDWIEDKHTPFGTTIVLSVNQTELLATVNRAEELRVPSGIVWDYTYPFIITQEAASVANCQLLTAPTIWKDDGTAIAFRNEFTCGYVFVADKSTDQEELVGAFPLHPYIEVTYYGKETITQEIYLQSTKILVPCIKFFET